MKTLSKTLFALTAVAAFSVALATSASTAANPESAAASLVRDRTSRLEYHDLWRKLWEDHITWTRIVIIVILEGRPSDEIDAYVARLLQNPQDMAEALQPFYGSAAGALGALIADHLVIAKEILDTAHAGGDIGGLVEQWYANAHEIAVQMNSMNPGF